EPQARKGEGKAPQDGFVFIEQNDLATPSLVLQGGEFERAVSEISRGGIKATSGTIVAYRLFLNFADAFAAHLHAGLVSQDGREFLTIPLRMERTMVEGVFVH